MVVGLSKACKVGLILVAVFGVLPDTLRSAPSADLPPPAPFVSGSDSDHREPELKSGETDAAGSELVDINIPEMTGLDIIAASVARWSGRNMILEPALKGKKIRIIAPQKLTKEVAYKTFLSALDMLGLSTVETGRVVKIIATRKAIKDNPPIYRTGDTLPESDQLITQVLSLKYIDAKWIQSTLSRFTTPGSVVPVEATNSLIISDSASKVARVLSIISLMDVKSQQSNLKIFPVRYGQASEISKKVQDLLAVSTAAKKGKKSPLKSRSSGGVKLVYDDLRNIIGVFAPPGHIDQVENYIKILDRKPIRTEYSGKIFVLPLEFSDAKKMATTLNTLSSSPKARSTATRRSRISKNRRKKPGGIALSESGFKITADEASNSLLVTGDQAAKESVSYVVRRFDHRRDQVLIEAQLLEVGSTNEFKAGSTFLLGQGRSDGAGTKIITGWEAGDMGPQIIASTDAVSGQSAENQAKLFTSNLTDGFTIGALASQGVTVPGIGKITPGAFMRLVKSDQNTRVLSSPYILALDNEEAVLSVGETLFFRTEKDSGGGVASSVEKENIDLTMTVKPGLGWGDYVSLNFELDGNAIAGISDGGLPRVNKRKIKSKLTLKNGQTAVVAGALNVREIESVKKVPGLGDLPIIGNLFKKTDKSFSNQQMIIFLTTWIIRGPEDLKRIYEEKMKESKDFLVSLKGEGTKESRFYTELPGDEAGAYEQTELDIWEEGIRQKLRRESAKEMGYGDGSMEQEY